MGLLDKLRNIPIILPVIGFIVILVEKSIIQSQDVRGGIVESMKNHVNIKTSLNNQLNLAQRILYGCVINAEHTWIDFFMKRVKYPRIPPTARWNLYR